MAMNPYMDYEPQNLLGFISSLRQGLLYVPVTVDIRIYKCSGPSPNSRKPCSTVVAPCKDGYSPSLSSTFTYPKGPSTQIVGFQGPKTIQSMDFGT